MPSPTTSYPASGSGDEVSVKRSLEAGLTEWKRGDLGEAVRWVRRAADAAEAAGDNVRARELALKAAELATQLELKLEFSASEEEAALVSFDDFNDQTIVDSPAVVTARSQPSSGTLSVPVRKEPERAESSSSPRSALPPRPDKKPPKSKPDGASVAVPYARPRTALRVAVVRKPGSRTLSAEVLEEGAPLPSGASEALLVLLDPQAASQFDFGSR